MILLSKVKYSFCVLVFSLLTTLTLLLSSCKDGSEVIEICSPSGVKIPGDSIVYVYGSDHRLSEIQFRSKTVIYLRHLITYTNGKPTKLTKMHFQAGAPERQGESYVLTYGSNGYPSSVIYFQANGQANDTTTFAYDANDRLVKRDVKFYNMLVRSTRYEYSSSNNVSKIYYLQGVGGTEKLGREIFSFDSHKRFFAGSKDLAIINTYIFDYEPSENNVLSEKIYGTLGSSYIPPLSATYTLTYDEKGNVKSMSSNSAGIIFTSIKYACH